MNYFRKFATVPFHPVNIGDHGKCGLYSQLFVGIDNTSTELPSLSCISSLSQ